MANELLSQSRKLNKRGDPNKSGVVGKFFEKKNKWGKRDAYWKPESWLNKHKLTYQTCSLFSLIWETFGTSISYCKVEITFFYEGDPVLKRWNALA